MPGDSQVQEREDEDDYLAQIARGSWLKAMTLAAALGLFSGLNTPQALATHLKCGDVIAQDTRLDSDLSCALVIGADGITVDLGGHAVDGVDNSAGYDRVTLTKGTVEGDVSLVGTAQNVVSGLKVSGEILLDGFDYGDSAQNRIERNLAGLITLYGSRDNEVEQNRLPRIGFELPLGLITLESASDNEIRRNVVLDSLATGIFLHASDRNRIERNRVWRSRGNEGILVAGSSSNVIEQNDVRDSSSQGIVIGSLYHGDLSDENIVVKNKVERSVSDGIVVQGPSVPYSGGAHTVVEKNVASYNGDDGIQARSTTTTLSSNTANFNFDLGIEAVPGVIDGGGNRATGNGNPLQCLNVACK